MPPQEKKPSLSINEKIRHLWERIPGKYKGVFIYPDHYKQPLELFGFIETNALSDELCSLRDEAIENIHKTGNPKQFINQFISNHSKLPDFFLIFRSYEFPEHIKLINVNFNGFDLSDSVFRNANLHGTLFDRATLNKTKFLGCTLTGNHKSPFSATLCEFTDCNMKGCSWEGANLENCRISGGDVRGVSFNNAKLAGARFFPTHADEVTRLESLDTFEGMKISRTILKSLGDSHGGLSIAQIQTLKVSHDLYTLQRSFGGFYGLSHLIALILWLFPYLWFVIVRLVDASFIHTKVDNSVPLVYALFRFAYNGPEHWRDCIRWPSIFFYTFLIGAVYNSLRAYFLFTTKQHELEERITGLPSSFKIEGRIRKFWIAHFYIFKIFLIAAMWAMFIFLSKPVPMDK